MAIGLPERENTELIFWGIIGAVTGGATAFPVPGSGTWAEGATELQLPIPSAGRVMNLYVYARTASGGVVTDTITIRRNGANTAITCTLVGAAVSGNDITNRQGYLVGDRISVSYVAGAGSVAANIIIVVEIKLTE